MLSPPFYRQNSTICRRKGQEGKEVKSIRVAINTAAVLAHYGYEPGRLAPTRGIWENDSAAIQRLSKLPELLERYGDGKLRVVFDYDPEYPRALIQVWGLRKVSLPGKDSQTERLEM